MSWRERAACLDRPDLDATWVGEDHNPDAIAEAKRVCWACPVIIECERDMLQDRGSRDVAGVVAGTCEEDRRGRRGYFPRPGCGTNAGYSRHIYLGDPACGPCLQAHREYNRAHYKRKSA